MKFRQVRSDMISFSISGKQVFQRFFFKAKKLFRWQNCKNRITGVKAVPDEGRDKLDGGAWREILPDRSNFSPLRAGHVWCADAPTKWGQAVHRDF